MVDFWGLFFSLRVCCIFRLCNDEMGICLVKGSEKVGNDDFYRILRNFNVKREF